MHLRKLKTPISCGHNVPGSNPDNLPNTPRRTDFLPAPPRLWNRFLKNNKHFLQRMKCVIGKTSFSICPQILSMRPVQRKNKLYFRFELSILPLPAILIVLENLLWDFIFGFRRRKICKRTPVLVDEQNLFLGCFHVSFGFPFYTRETMQSLH